MTGLTEIKCRPEIIGQIQGILLSQALLCINCEVIYSTPPTSNNSSCPNCTSQCYIRLSDIFNKPPEEKVVAQ